MKIGFLLNITLLLSFVCSQLMIWLLDGTLIKGLSQILYRPSYMMYQRNPPQDNLQTPTKNGIPKNSEVLPQ